MVQHKSLELMRWKWYQAPGGPMDSWVIENEQPDGAWKIVGHHGLCPTRFTFGDQDLICAKTANTMLLPEFRSRFLYLRFEQECLKEADKRFDAMYSCAPGTVRLREPLGYVADSTWIDMVRGLQTPEVVSRILGFVATRYPDYAWSRIKRAVVTVSSLASYKSPLSLTEHSSVQAPKSTFFSDFWAEARMLVGMSPRRDVADLAWRFWQRPDFKYSTLTYTWEGGARAYCVINVTDPLLLNLEDIFIAPLRPDLLEVFLTTLFAWCAQQGALLLRFSTTTNGQPKEFLETLARHMYLPPLRHFRPQMEFPRRFSPQGKSKVGNAGLKWNATRLLRPA
jgi:hypothetical protein